MRTYSEIKKALNSGSLTPLEITTECLNRLKTVESKVKAFIHFNEETILKQAQESDNRRKSGKPLSEFDGIPIGIKDNICIKGERTTAGSKILENFVSPYNATVIEKLLEKGFILFPGLNMDEFAMGSSTENSAYHISKNPFDTERIPGGSSGGSAVAVASSILPVALGSDTGGSIRQPASLCGVYGLKPTYGRVSRYGLIAYASSLDQIGPFSNDPEGIEDILKIISGADVHDATSKKTTLPDFNVNIEFKGLKIGIMEEGREWSSAVKSKYSEMIEFLKSKGTILEKLDFSLNEYSIPIYYIIATAECSSNLSRFDGIRFGFRNEDGKKLEDLYLDSRSQGFGKEVKRRILLGTFSLSSGYYDAYYGKAQKARALIRKGYESYFKKVDFILQPTSPTTAFKIGEKTKDPVQMYKADILTTSVNLAGVPAISIPAGLDDLNLPIGMQITAPFFEEGRLLAFVKKIAEEPKFSIKLPEFIK
jgi:aspartyl-tRNA(Asn)/glutamyl-tRNA(Gln) amidotransferase subunit A